MSLSQVIQQSLGQQVSQPVAQVVAGFAKVFVGEIVEKGMFQVIRAEPRYTVADYLSSCSAGCAEEERRYWAVISGPPAGSLPTVSAGDWSCGCCKADKVEEAVRKVTKGICYDIT